MWHRGVVKRSTSGLPVYRLKQNHQGPEAEDTTAEGSADKMHSTVFAEIIQNFLQQPFSM